MLNLQITCWRRLSYSINRYRTRTKRVKARKVIKIQNLRLEKNDVVNDYTLIDVHLLKSFKKDTPRL